MRYFPRRGNRIDFTALLGWMEMGVGESSEVIGWKDRVQGDTAGNGKLSG